MKTLKIVNKKEAISEKEVRQHMLHPLRVLFASLDSPSSGPTVVTTNYSRWDWDNDHHAQTHDKMITTWYWFRVANPRGWVAREWFG